MTQNPFNISFGKEPLMDDAVFEKDRQLFKAQQLVLESIASRL